MPSNNLFRARKRLRSIKAYQQVFESDAGRIVLADLAHHAGMMGPAYARSVTEPDGMARALAMAFNDGQRDLVAFILSQLKMDMEDVQKIIDEELKYERSASGPRQPTAE